MPSPMGKSDSGTASTLVQNGSLSQADAVDVPDGAATFGQDAADPGTDLRCGGHHTLFQRCIE